MDQRDGRITKHGVEKQLSRKGLGLRDVPQIRVSAKAVKTLGRISLKLPRRHVDGYLGMRFDCDRTEAFGTESDHSALSGTSV